MTAAELKAARHALGLSAEGFARLVGVESGRTVRRWEAGDRDIPGPVIVLTWLMLNCKPALRAIEKFADMERDQNRQDPEKDG